MDHHRKAVRVGKAAIAVALIFRLWTAGLPGKILTWLTQPNIAAFLIYLETGRDVRFSASQEVFLAYPPESAPPLILLPPEIPEELPPEKVPLPVFLPEDTALTDLYYACSLRPELEELLTAPLSWNLADGSPTVLILHTHTTESYTQAGENYVETSEYRTLDENYNMLSIGARVAEILSENGIGVIQDRNLHDYPSYNGSYNDARSAIQSYLQAYPGIQLVLDLHRDAIETTGGQLRTLADLEGQPCAQLMLVMGTNASGLTHENWQDNLSLALKLQAQLEKLFPGITRPTILRGQRFNQDLHSGALLVEVGAAGNTHREAMLAAEALAQAIITLAKGTK